MRTSLTAIALVASVGCASPTYEYSGYRTYDPFPLDGERYWNYQNPNEEYLLDVTIDSTEYVGNRAVRTLRYENGSLDSVLYWIKWSSDSGSGVQIHGYMVEEGTGSVADDSEDDWDCLKITIESDEASPPPFVGTWHWATEFGTSLFQPKDSLEPWILTDFDWSPE